MGSALQKSLNDIDNLKTISLPLSNTDTAHNTVPVEQKIRFLSHRRLVLKSRWQEQPVCIKLFFHTDSAYRDWQREQSGYDLARASNVTTSACLLSEFQDGVGVIIYQWLSGHTLKQLTSDDALDEKAFQLLIQSIGQLHKKGLVQHDIHLDNFLLSEGVVHCLDLASLEKYDVRSKTIAVTNFALLCAQLPPAVQKNVSWYNTYCATQNLPSPSSIQLDQFRRLTHKLWQKRLRKWQAKIYRQCSAFAMQKRLRKYLVYAHDIGDDLPWLERLCEAPAALLTNETVLKSGRNATVYRVETEHRAYVIKHYHSKTLWARIRRAIQSSRASISWKAAHSLQYAGVKTARPVALFEKRFGPLRGDALFITEYVDGVRGAELFSNYPANKGIYHQAIEQLALLMFKLFCARLFHGDMKWHNIVFSNSDWYLLDLEQLKIIDNEHKFNQKFKQDMHRLFRNWESIPHEQQTLIAAMKKYPCLVKFIPSTSS